MEKEAVKFLTTISSWSVELRWPFTSDHKLMQKEHQMISIVRNWV